MVRTTKTKLLYLFMPALLTVLCLFVSPACADYSFAIPRAETTIWIESDGSFSLDFIYQFENHGQALDYIDIGLPNNDFLLSDVAVYLDDVENTRINKSYADYEESGLNSGVTLEMGKDAIPSGGSATVEVTVQGLRYNLYEATSEKSEEEDEAEIPYVGFQYQPNYFNAKMVEGNTHYKFTIVFPEGVDGDHSYYYDPENWPGEMAPEAFIQDGHVVLFWEGDTAKMGKEYIFGGKFPRSALSTDANIMEDVSSVFDQSDDGTEELICIGLPLGLFGLFFVFAAKKAKKQEKLKNRAYFPASVKTDGEGIKRGLTAVEAAVLAEMDIEKLLSMILYGLAKKKAIVVESLDPLQVTVSQPEPEELRDYEKQFLAALQIEDKKEQKTAMKTAFSDLVMSVAEKMKGFSYKETRAYYASICKMAWEQVEKADTPELKAQMLGDTFGWTMLEEDSEKHYERTFGEGEMVPPEWWWRVDPGCRPMHSSWSFPDSPSSSSGGSSSEKRGGSTSSGGRPQTMPVLPGAMFVRSLTDSARGFSRSVVGKNMDDFRHQVKETTNPTPVVSGGGHSSGSDSSCACACACDSCACACAGGGR